MSTKTGSAAPSPLTSLARRWPLAAALGIALAVLGYLGASALPSTTTAQSRVAVGPGDMSAGAIAGFPEATRSMAEDYARWVTSTGVLKGGNTKVSGSPIPESNVILVEATSQDAAAVVPAAKAAAEQLVKQVNDGQAAADPQQTLGKVKTLSSQWSAAKTELARSTWEFDQVNESDTSTNTAYNRAAGALTKAQAAEAYLKAQIDAQSEKYKQQVGNASQAADLRIVQPAQVASNTANSLRQRYAILGLFMGVLLALIIATLLDRRRNRDPDET